MAMTLLDYDEAELIMLLQTANISHAVATDIAKLIRRMMKHSLQEEEVGFDD